MLELLQEITRSSVNAKHDWQKSSGYAIKERKRLTDKKRFSVQTLFIANVYTLMQRISSKSAGANKNNRFGRKRHRH